MKRPTTILIFLIISLLSLSQTAQATDIIYTYDSGGGHDYTALATWEGHTDVDLGSANTKVFSTSNYDTSRAQSTTDFPDGTAVRNAANDHTGTVIAVLAEGEQILISTTNLTGEVVYKTSTYPNDYFTVDAGVQVNFVYLDCYDSQNHDDYTYLSGASNTDATHYRCIRSSPNCTTPFAGKAGTGANFVYDGTEAKLFSFTEEWARLENVAVKYIGTYGDVACAVKFDSAHCKAINVVVYDCNNQSVGNGTSGFYATADQNLFYNCIVYGGDGFAAFRMAVGANETAAAISCTAVNSNATYGFYGSTSGTAIVFNCYAADHGTADFREDLTWWSAPSGWNAAKDTTADLNGTAGDNYKNSIDLTDTELDSNYLALTGISWNGAAGDRAGRNPYNDVTATCDFDDFFKNDTDGETISKKDITGRDRLTPDIADASWDVGASEYVSRNQVIFIGF